VNKITVKNCSCCDKEPEVFKRKNEQNEMETVIRCCCDKWPEVTGKTKKEAADKWNKTSS
jgi:hypothetical protein